jgi:hypothetical protein
MQMKANGKFEIQIQNKDMFHIMSNAARQTKKMQKFTRSPIDGILDPNSDASIN